jgi:two-component system, response regulator
VSKDENRLLVLLVEDNPDDERMTLRALKKSELDVEVVVARDGVEALDRLFSRNAYEGHPPIRPSVVLLDLKLPKVGGFEVLEAMRGHEETRFIPVVVLTSSDETPDIEKAYRFGANSYIAKPVEFDKFMRTVETLGLYWLVENRPY